MARSNSFADFFLGQVYSWNAEQVLLCPDETYARPPALKALVKEVTVKHDQLEGRSNYRTNPSTALVIFAVVFYAILCEMPCLGAPSSRIELREGWALQSSCKATQGGSVFSTVTFRPRGWYATTVPSTVLAAQVAAGEFKDPYYAENLRKIPGTSYPIGRNFAELPMAAGSPYACSWWYRTEFRLPPDYKDRNVWLHFNGINYRANIWLNGHKVAADNEVSGTYRIYEFDVTPYARPNDINVVAVETFAQAENDLGINFVDWAPMPPDKDLGLWRDVYVTASGPVTVRYPYVTTHFTDDTLRRADITVRTELHNASDQPVEGVLEGNFENHNFRRDVKLSPGEVRSVRFTPEEFPQLHVNDPKLWWPVSLGPQNLYSLEMRFLIGNEVSDEQQTQFGIREITAQLNGPSPQPGKMYHIGSGKLVETDTRPLLFRVNHKNILIRGAGWAPDLLLRSSRERLQTELQYVRDMHLNAIRLEGKLETDEFFNLADEIGILVIAGWCCCDRWEKWDTWQSSDLKIATESLRAQILRLRRHPSLMIWINGSDFAPPANVEQAYIKVLQETEWPNPYVSSASAMPTTVTGASGVKMTGPYDYVPPSYWLTDTGRYGGAFGFMTETSPGPAIPLASSLRKMIPPDQLWPIDNVWNFHAGAGSDFNNLKHYNDSMDAIYGAPSGLDDYIKKSQAMAYDGERAMFEAYTRNKYRSTGVIQWMLNNAWPSVVWHLYDYFLQPAGGYFGTKKACEPLHVQYSYDNRSVVVVNNEYRDISGLTVTAELYDFELNKKFVGQVGLDSPADSVQQALVVPEISPAPKVSFLNLTLRNNSGEVQSSNFYWLPAKLSSFDWDLDRTNEHAYYSAVTSYEDLTMLNQLPKAHVEASVNMTQNGGRDIVRVVLHNSSDHLAFQIRLGIHQAGQAEEILPVFWQDNYVSLLPNESRTIVAHYAPHKLDGHPELDIDGWNLDRFLVRFAQTNQSGN
jgi:exo-1,4-beta-D-glucosaminidase